MLNKYKCRPVEIEAYKLEDNEESIINAIKFIFNKKDEIDLDYYKALIEVAFSVKGLIITNENITLIALFGDYIIKELNSKFRVCKPDVFDLYYQQIRDI